MFSPFTALANSKRRKIIELLSERPLTSTEIANNFDIYHHSVSKHLKVLLNANLVTFKKSGRLRIYRLNKKTVKKVILQINSLL